MGSGVTAGRRPTPPDPLPVPVVDNHTHLDLGRGHEPRPDLAATLREAAAVGVPHETKGDAVVVFAIAVPGAAIAAGTAEEVRQHIGQQLGAALRPERVVFVSDLPRTRNAKIMRRVIRAAWLGLPPGETSALENPAAIGEIAARRKG